MLTLSTLESSSEIEDRYSGVRALWAKVIIRAMYDYVSYKDSPKIALRKYADGAERWLFSQSEVFNSFESICRMLGISSRRVRDRAKTMTKDQISKIEHVDRTISGVSGTMLVDAKFLLSSFREASSDRDYDEELFEDT